jgi:hypothetical protein
MNAVTDNVRQLSTRRRGRDTPAEDLAAVADLAAAQALDILADISEQLEQLTALLRVVAAYGDANTAVLLSTIATDIDMTRYALPQAIAVAVRQTEVKT